GNVLEQRREPGAEAGLAALVLQQGCLEDDARLLLHAHAMPRRPLAQAPLQVVVEFTHQKLAHSRSPFAIMIAERGGRGKPAKTSHRRVHPCACLRPLCSASQMPPSTSAIAAAW